MLLKLGFQQSWVDLILECISSVSYTVAVNGDRSENFFPGRGLRQGDPLSPYLFLICADGFSTLLHQAAKVNRLVGVSAGWNAPKMTHLLFTDDSLLFCKAEANVCKEIARILRTYEKASGQQINLEKSSVFFSPCVSDVKRERLMNELGIGVVMRGERYLGLPMILGLSKKDFFGSVVEKIGKRVNGWKELFCRRLIEKCW